uniref:Uncharacterized protein n=1 Tax=Hucho hucho TaxID=62062 RepID=A0A4W5PIT0_9TELE
MPDGYGKQGLVLAKHHIGLARLALQSSYWVSSRAGQRRFWMSSVHSEMYMI